MNVEIIIYNLLCDVIPKSLYFNNIFFIIIFNLNLKKKIKFDLVGLIDQTAVQIDDFFT